MIGYVQSFDNSGKVCWLLPDVDARADTDDIMASRLLLTDRATSVRITLTDVARSVNRSVSSRWAVPLMDASIDSRDNIESTL